MLYARIGLRITRASLPPCSSTSAFHTSQLVQETRRSRLARTAKKENVENRAERVRSSGHTKPDPILGHAPGNEAKWQNCDLAKVLISQRELQAPSNIAHALDTISRPILPEAFQHGIGGDTGTQHLLFHSLPDVSSHQLSSWDSFDPQHPDQQAALDEEKAKQRHNVHMLSRLVDLRNASAAGIAFENRRRCIMAFSEPDKPNDTGRPEVQAALFTMKIRKLWEHLQRNRKDTANRRSLRMLVHQRAKVLKYLRRLDRQRYEIVLGRLGIEEGAVEGELVV